MNSCLRLCYGKTGPDDCGKETIVKGAWLSELNSWTTGEAVLGAEILENKLWFCWRTKSVDI